jgi:hypothetical protein
MASKSASLVFSSAQTPIRPRGREAELEGVDADLFLLAQPFDQGVAGVALAGQAGGAEVRHPVRPRAFVTAGRIDLAVVPAQDGVLHLFEIAELVDAALHARQAVATFRVALVLHDLDDGLDPHARAGHRGLRTPREGARVVE